MNHSVSSLFGAPIPESKILTALQKKPDVLEQFRQFSEEDRSRILAFLAGERSLQILSDRFFKQILNPESTPERLESLLSAVFGQKVTIAGIISREGMQITETGSQVIMDRSSEEFRDVRPEYIH